MLVHQSSAPANNSVKTSLVCASAAGELLMAVRQHASTMHDRDRLMETAFEGIGGLPMAAIERYREQRRCVLSTVLDHWRHQLRFAVPHVGRRSREHIIRS